MQKPGRKIDFLLLGLSRSALRMSFNKPFIFIPFFDLSELLLLGQTSDFLHSYILFTIFIHMFNQGRVSPSGGSLASFFSTRSRKNLALSRIFLFWFGSLGLNSSPIKSCCLSAIPAGIPAGIPAASAIPGQAEFGISCHF